MSYHSFFWAFCRWHSSRIWIFVVPSPYASVSLYVVLAMFWFSAYNLTETVAPGSFIQTVPAQTTDIHPDTLLYFSVATLTTLGFGDVIPVSAPARVFAALEAVSGVLYLAITVARLVAAYQLRSGGDTS